MSARWAALVVGVAACAAMRPALTGPEAGGPSWRELTTPHFILRTDLGTSSARKIIEDFERIEQVFIDLSPGMPVPAPTHVLVFARQYDYDAIAPRESIGFFARDPRQHGAPLIVLFGPYEERTRRVLQHELTHRFIAEQIKKPPVWLNEGLASYFETVTFNKGKLEAGRADWQLDVGIEEPRVVPVPIEDLLAADAAEFYGQRDFEYTQTAWAFVHMLRATRPGYSERFAKYVKSLRDGVDAKAAWKDAFADVSIRDLQVSFNNYIAGPFLTMISIPYDPPPPPVPEVRVLSEEEVDELLEWLRMASKASEH